MSKLKPCPFCGGEVDSTIWTDYLMEWQSIHCHKCGLLVTFREDSEADLIDAWNERAILPDDVVKKDD